MMRWLLRVFILLFAAGALAAGLTYWYVQRNAPFSARTEPTRLETAVALRLRRLSIPAAERAKPNPLPATAKNVRDGMEHFADHCAICHANTGAGDTPLGRGLYPHPPILREARTQSLTDGEMFSIIQNGIRFTGMPAFGDSEHTEEDSWKCVLFIRHLPQQTPEEIAEMEKLNPRAPDEAAPKTPEKPPHLHTHVHGGQAKD
jgi:mono/diheme cytochrome c family protein